MSEKKSTGAGKGSKPRAVDGNKYRDNWDRIFKKKKVEEK
jgi:hypothetical protein